MRKNSIKNTRVNGEVQRELSNIIRGGIKDPRVTREGSLIFEGPLASLKRFKDDVKEVRAGYECGFVFEKFNDVKEFDLVEAYKMVEVPR